jgi:hypothetical protein
VRIPVVFLLQFGSHAAVRIVDQPQQPADLQALRAGQAVVAVVYTKDTSPRLSECDLCLVPCQRNLTSQRPTYACTAACSAATM